MYDGSEKVPDMSCGTLVLTTHRLAYVDDARPLDQSRYVRLALVQQTEHYAGFLKSSPKITLLLRDGREGGAWTCRVCAFENTTSLDGRCALCGVVRASEDVQESVACAACTFLNHPTLPRCELCETPLPKARTGPLAVKLSFRQGGDKPFYAHLRATLLATAWKTEAARAAAGIDGVISKDTHAAAPAPDAFQDLEALMHQARSMVRCLAYPGRPRILAAHAARAARAPPRTGRTHVARRRRLHDPLGARTARPRGAGRDAGYGAERGRVPPRARARALAPAAWRRNSRWSLGQAQAARPRRGVGLLEPRTGHRYVSILTQRSSRRK